MMKLAESHGLTRFVSMQNHYNLIYREEEREMIPLCIDEGIAVIPWSPLARGFLAGNRSRATERAQTDDIAQGFYVAQSDVTIADRVAEVAKKRGVRGGEITVAWILKKTGVRGPMVGGWKMAQL